MESVVPIGGVAGGQGFLGGGVFKINPAISRIVIQIFRRGTLVGQRTVSQEAGI